MSWCYFTNICYRKKKKKNDQKLENCKFAYTSYNNLLIELRDSLRSGVFDEKLFFHKSVVFDNIIINDNCVSIPEKK